MTQGKSKGDVFSRWSDRKQAVAREEQEEAERAAALADEPDDAQEDEPQTEEEALAKLAEDDPELAEQLAGVDIDNLKYEDDFKIFMSERVPHIIRRRALAKLWLTDPILANVDGLNDYDEDFKAAAEVVKVIKSSWEPGRGYATPDEDEPEEEASPDEQEPVASQEPAETETAAEEDSPETESVAADDTAGHVEDTDFNSKT